MWVYCTDKYCCVYGWGVSLVCSRVKWHGSGGRVWVGELKWCILRCGCVEMGNWVTVVLDARFKWLYTNPHGVTSQKTWIFFVWVIKLLLNMHAYMVWLMITTTCCSVWRCLCYTPNALTRSFPHCLWARLWDEIQFLQEVSYIQMKHVGVLTEEKLENGARLETSASKSVTWLAQQIFCVLFISTRWNGTVVFASIWGKCGC